MIGRYLKRKYSGNRKEKKNKIKRKEKKEETRNVRGKNKMRICGQNDTKYTKYTKFTSISEINFKYLTLRRLMSYIYGAPILDVSRSHTTTQHSR